MRKKFIYFSILLLLWQSFPVFAQPGVAATSAVKKEKEKFLHTLTSVSNDSAIIFPLARYFESEMNTIYAAIGENDELSTVEKEKAVRSLVYFIKELGYSLKKQSLSLYDIPGAVNSYSSILAALLYQRPVTPILEPLGSRRSQLMAASFTQYKEYSLLDDIAVYKRVASSPEFILQFLENKPGFRFADSLLLDAAAYDPMKIIFYLNRNRPGVQDKIRNTNNIYLKQIALLAADKNASELLPFVVQIAENKVSAAEITGKRTEPLGYFQLLINTLQEPCVPGDPRSIFIKPLRSGIKQKALSFYVNEINDLHNAADAVRFASVKDLRPQDLYYIITSCGEELYTSSYLGLYKRLMENFKDQPTDPLFDIVEYNDLRTFIRLAANYNVLGDLLQRISPEKRKDILRRFTAGIESDENTALEKAMDIADSFTAFIASPEGGELIESELRSNLSRCQSAGHYLGIRLYGILSDILSQVKQNNGMSKLWSTLGDYEVLKREAMVNDNNEITELVLFYGDEDGVASFNNFLRSYTDKNKWEISRNENWVSVRSLSGQPLTIYANRPLDIKQEMDLKAQDSLMAFLQAHSLKPAILVHRGHSYHLEKTLKRLSPSVKLAILGSCGGYNKSISIATINPDVQVIGSKKTGSKSINDPIINVINETLLNKKDIHWPEVWKTLEKRFMKDEVAFSMFNEYFPPSNNLGLFVLKLFNFYRQS